MTNILIIRRETLRFASARQAAMLSPFAGMGKVAQTPIRFDPDISQNETNEKVW